MTQMNPIVSVAGAVFRGSLAHNAARTTLSVLAIALGIALGYAVQLINQAAINELSSGVQALCGHTDRHVILLFVGWRWRCVRTWEIDTNPLHMGLAQAHHHEAGEQEKHDVNQRNDLDARVLFWEGRSYSHRV
jgi:hypothetical protein